MIRQYVQRGKQYVPAKVSMRSRPTSYHGAGVGCSCLAVTVRGVTLWIEGLGDQAVHFYSRKPLRYTK